MPNLDKKIGMIFAWNKGADPGYVLILRSCYLKIEEGEVQLHSIPLVSLGKDGWWIVSTATHYKNGLGTTNKYQALESWTEISDLGFLQGIGCLR